MRYILLILISLAAALLLPSATNAQRVAANTLKVSPVRTDIEVALGMRKVVQITATNLDSKPVTVTPVANDFIAGDEKGTPALILDETDRAPVHSLKRFLSPLQTVTIPAKESVTVPVVVTVPADAQAGGYYGAVRFMPSSPDGGGQVNVSPSVASLILLRVPGDALEQLKLTHFSIFNDNASGFYFQTPEALQVYARFENIGNVQVAPQGKVVVSKKWSDAVWEHDFNIENPKGMILPDSARRWDIPLKDLDGIGYYTVTATLVYGEKNSTVEVSHSFLVAPLWLVLILIVVPLLLIASAIVITIFVTRRRKRRRSRMVRRRFGR